MVVPCEEERLPCFLRTLQRYRELGLDRYDYELVVPTRTLAQSDALGELQLRHRLVPYCYDAPYFNPAMALNLGVRTARYDTILVQSPEVMPVTDVLAQFSSLPEGNYIAQVWDLDPRGKRLGKLAVPRFIHYLAGAYFLAWFRKVDLYAINGWDEDFMGGYCFEDNDFGRRWHTAGIPVDLREEIVAEHQWHPRSSGVSPGWKRNCRLYYRKRERGQSRCRNGLVKGRSPNDE